MTGIRGRSRSLASLVIAGILLGIPVLRAGTNVWTGSHPVRPSIDGPALVASDPRDPYVVYAVFQPDLYRSADGGRSWTRVASFDQVTSLLVHPLAPDTVYVGTGEGRNPTGYGGVVKSSDGGRTWSRMPFNTSEGTQQMTVTALAGSPTDPLTVIAGTYVEVYKTRDGGAHWFRISSISGMIACLVINPTAPSTVYAGSEGDYYYFPFGGVDRSANGGETWERTPLREDITSLAIDPAVTTTLYAGTRSSGVARSQNSGTSWSVNAAGLPEGISSVVIDPANTSTVYAGTARGVYRSRDSGVTWVSMSQAVTEVPVDSLVISSDGRTLHAGSPRGEFGLDLAIGPTDVAAGLSGSTRILSWNADRLSVRTLDGSGSWSSTPEGAASSTWTAAAIAGGLDGLSRVLWQSGDGRSAIEVVGTQGRVSAVVFGREPALMPADISVALDGRTRLLWTSTAGRMYLSATAPDGTTSVGPDYGPTAGWSAIAISDAPDGTTWVLWRCTDGRAAVSIHREGLMLASFRLEAILDWAVEDLTMASDGRARILATTTAGHMQIWTVGPNGVRIVGESRELAGVAPRRIDAGADGFTRVLWTDRAGRAVVSRFDLGGALISDTDVPAQP